MMRRGFAAVVAASALVGAVGSGCSWLTIGIAAAIGASAGGGGGSDPAPLGPGPVVTGISTTSGPVGGGTPVIITGTNFQTGATANIGVGVVNISAMNLTSITGFTTTGAVGPANVVVTNPDGQTSTLFGAYLYLGLPPTVTGVNPGFGAAGGGTLVTLAGTNFVAGAQVLFGTGGASAINVQSSTQLTCVSPAGPPGFVNVGIINPDFQQAGLPGGYQYIAAPAVFSCTPSGGAPFTAISVTIAGANFGLGATVQIGGTAATSVVVVSAGQITCTTPSLSAGSYAVAVTNPDSQFGLLSPAWFVDGTAPTFGGWSQVSNVSSYAQELQWTAGSDNQTAVGQLRYAVYLAYATGGQNYAAPPHVLTDPGVTRVVVGGLRPGTTPFLVVRARDQAGNDDGNTSETNLSQTSPVTPRGWRTTGSLGTARSFPAITPLLDGRVLASGGFSGGGPTSTCELFDPDAGTWTSTQSFTTGVGRASATLLTDGRVLLAGGDFGMTVTTAAEVYDPTQGTWSATNSMANGRHKHAALLLRDGRVLVICGGTFSPGPPPMPGNLAAAEIYDPSTTNWTATGNAPAQARFDPSAVILADGRVLVAGGDASTASTEIYDPAADTWTTGPNLGTARVSQGMLALRDGRVLIIGGLNTGGSWIASCELYDPATNTWTNAAPMPGGRADFQATLLPSGWVVVSGGNPTLQSDSRFYDPATDAWSLGPTMAQSRMYHGAATLHDGRTILIGGDNGSGFGVASCEVLDPDGGGWRSASGLGQARARHAVALLPDGRVLASGGGSTVAGSASNTSEIFDPATGTWTATGLLPSARRGHRMVNLLDGRVVATGGASASGNSLQATDIYDPVNGTWSTSATMNNARRNHGSVRLLDARVLVVGGNTGTNSTGACEIWDPATGNWTIAPTMAQDRWRHAAMVLPDGRVLAIGGNSTSSGTVGSCELYNPAGGGWSTAAALGNAREDFLCVQLPGGAILVAGGYDTGTNSDLASAEIYDPTTATWTNTGPLGAARKEMAGFRLHDGTVLAAGGLFTGAIPPDATTCEVWDPLTGLWAATQGLQFGTSSTRGVLLHTGEVLLVGGENNGTLMTSCWLFTAGHGMSDPDRPRILTVAGSGGQPTQLSYATVIGITGVRFRQRTEASRGDYGAASSNFPIVVVEGPLSRTGSSGGAVGAVRMVWPASSGTGASSLSLTTPSLGTLPRGQYHLRVVVNGLSSEAWLVELP